MKRALYDVQQKHMNVLMAAMETYGSAIDGSSTGCGKTLVGAEIAVQGERPTFIVCPKSSVPMWELEMKDRGWAAHGVLNYEMLRTGRTQWGNWVGTDGWKGTAWAWNLPKDAFIIWDECQKCMGMNTQNARMMWSSRNFYNLMLSATAAEDPTEMKALGYLLRLHDLKGFWNWTKMHGCSDGTYGGLAFSGTDEDIDSLHRIIYPRHGSRLTRHDMREHFTETQIITTAIDFGDEIKKIFATMQAELNTLTTHSRGDAADNELTIRLRARQRAELLKVPYIVELTEDLLKEHLAVAIFVNFDATLEAIKARLEAKHKVGMVSGRYLKDRQKHLDDFQTDRSHVILCNVQAGGVSVNLHDTRGYYPRTALISPSDNAKEILQCIGRIDRAGALSNTQQHLLFAAGTVEEEVKDNCDDKIRRIGILNDGLTKPLTPDPE
jgi:hypothetical protein